MNTCRKMGPLWGAQKSTYRMSFCALTKAGTAANVMDIRSFAALPKAGVPPVTRCKQLALILLHET